ncbi:Putative Alpha/beta hydrolase family domain-containing protein [Rhizopus microsporus]|nr:Putative Alpha/beta hydrolase family domain-containing protein [Rhizopus microsporus]
MSSLEREIFKKPQLPLESIRADEENFNNIPPSQRQRSSSQKYSPNEWQDYFDESINLNISRTNDVFRIYKTDSVKPDGPLFLMHHGAGSSGLSFGWVAKHIKELTKGEYGVIAIDCRGHGATKTEDELDFSLELVVNVAHKRVLKNIMGVTVIDVVEGSAIDALSSMTRILNSRPKQFNTYEQAIQWSIQSNTLMNLASAKLSIPPLLTSADNKLKWITDLSKTQPYWSEWFTGLSEKFLNSGTAKLLILAGTDRLDKPLIIGQMQGKFQLEIFTDSGHFVQEDVPMKTATCLIEFFRRNHRLILPPKVFSK